MLVSDIYESLSDALGTCEESYLFAVLSEGIELGANKGLYDPLIGYLSVTSGADNMVYLPRDVDVPIRINIDGNPSYSRDRLFEFSLNTDGTVTGDQVGWSWDDRGDYAIQKTLTTATKFAAKASNAADNAKTITVYGLDANNNEISETLTLAVSSPTVGAVEFSSVTRIVKPITSYYIELVDASSTVYARYYPDETDPKCRRIRVSKASSSLRIMYRRRTYKITSQSDFLPLHHRLAIILLCKAAKHYRDSNYEAAIATEEQATRMLNERQSALSEAAKAAQYDSIPATGLDIGVVEGIVVGDIYDEACEIAGLVGRQQVFDKITSAVEMLRNVGLWDADIGYVDLAVSGEYVTLPRYINRVLSINILGRPTIMRNKWFQFHLGGLGRCKPHGAIWDNFGDVITINPIETPLRLGAIAEDAADAGKTIKVYGVDDSGLVKTEVITATSGAIAPGSIKFAKIHRIEKESSLSFIRLFQVTDADAESTQLGYYYPDELEPRYQRIRIGSKNAESIRMLYRKRQDRISSMTDFINLKSRQAILLAMRSIEATKKDPAQGEQFRQAAIRLLSEEQAASNPGDTPTLQVEPHTSGLLSADQSFEW